MALAFNGGGKRVSGCGVGRLEGGCGWVEAGFRRGEVCVGRGVWVGGGLGGGEEG